MEKNFKYKVFGGDIKAMEITLLPQQEIKANADKLIYKDEGVVLERIKFSKIVNFKNTSSTAQVVTFLWWNKELN